MRPKNVTARFGLRQSAKRWASAGGRITGNLWRDHEPACDYWLTGRCECCYPCRKSGEDSISRLLIKKF